MGDFEQFKEKVVSMITPIRVYKAPEYHCCSSCKKKKEHKHFKYILEDNTYQCRSCAAAISNKIRYAKWAKDNPGKVRAKAARYRALKLLQTPAEANLIKIAQIYKEAAQIQKDTGVLMHVDHIIPLCKGGLHHEGNLQILTADENLHKGSKV